MTESFWKSIGEALAKEWVARLLAPAVVFWAGGLLAFGYRYGWLLLVDWWAARSAVEQVAVLVGGLLVAAFSGLAMEWVQDDLLRWVEGYWPPPLEWLRFALAKRWERRAQRLEERWQALAEKGRGQAEHLSPQERAEYARLDALRLRLPADYGRMMPTLVGNLLRAAEEYPQVRYGLAAGVCWPRLWLLLPKAVQEDISAARGRLDAAARLFGWGLLFVVWTVWAWWAAPVGLAVAGLAYRGMQMASLVYGDLVRAAFDLYRFQLYEQVRWPVPSPVSSPAEEPRRGEALTRYLFRGEVAPPSAQQPGPAAAPLTGPEEPQ